MIGNRCGPGLAIHRGGLIYLRDRGSLRTKAIKCVRTRWQAWFPRRIADAAWCLPLRAKPWRKGLAEYGTCLVALDGSRPWPGPLELFVASFFVIWFGLGALLVGLAMLAFPAMAFSAQILLLTAASVAMTVFWFKVLRNDGGKTRSGQADEALGEIGVLVRAVEPLGIESARGEVRFQKPVMGADVWPCLADEAIAAGTRVRVLAVDGQILKVAKY